MKVSTNCPFAIYYANEAYSTANKIMGRQSAGKAFLKGIVRTWPQGTMWGLGQGERAGQALAQQLQADGFTGQLKWGHLPSWQAVSEVGTLYYPAPPTKELAAARNLHQPAAFSLMGVTHTLSSSAAMDQVADLVLPPFKPWDALICTSQAARAFVSRLQEEVRHYWQEQTGATRFVDVQLPVIPLGVDVPAFAANPGSREDARHALGLQAEEVAFLVAGRLSFHAKANPAPVYQAMETVARYTPVVCIEAGVFPNEAIRQSYLAAQKALAPSVRFVWVDGQDEGRYRQAWQGGDVFVSLSDNIQETFGLTPVEAMAAGLPVVVSDWNGYKDTVREGVDGFRVPTVLPPAGVGEDLALRHALGLDTYDFYIGRTSLATVVEPNALADALRRLATDADLRRTMGAAGQARAQHDFDWPVILRRYAELATELSEIRQGGPLECAQPWSQRADPFLRFAHFPTATLGGDWGVRARPDAVARLQALLSLAMVNYAFDPQLLSQESLTSLLTVLQSDGLHTVNSALATAGQATPAGVRALMWLWKFDLLRVSSGTGNCSGMT